LKKVLEWEKSMCIFQKAWAAATSGFSSIFMMLFMMYMTGGGMNIFTLLITFSFIWQPISNLMKLGQG
jgi:hypothetical protein